MLLLFELHQAFYSRAHQSQLPAHPLCSARAFTSRQPLMHESHPAWMFSTAAAPGWGESCLREQQEQFTWCDLTGTLFTRPSVSEGAFCGACLTGDIKLSEVLQLTRWQSRVCTTMFKRHTKNKTKQKRTKQKEKKKKETKTKDE